MSLYRTGYGCMLSRVLAWWISRLGSPAGAASTFRPWPGRSPAARLRADGARQDPRTPGATDPQPARDVRQTATRSLLCWRFL